MEPAITRLCDLPWQNFVVNTQMDPPRAAPCHNFPLVRQARDLGAIDDDLRVLRRNLLSGSLDAPCRGCPDKPAADLDELQELLDRQGLHDRNPMIDALGQVVASGATGAPPAELMYRVAHTRDATDFLLSGTVTVYDFMPLIARHSRARRERLLDWGCGCGRMAIHIAARFPEVELSGCDIDREAVQWCRDNVAGDFRVIDDLPPTSFDRAGFTSIIGYSIVTHLSRAHQRKWIRELHSLLVDDGILVLTTMGETAARINGLADQLAAAGILDDRLDETLDAVMPAGYYRSTFQTRAYTEQAWGRRFEVLEYIEAGAFGYQDVVVLRKRRRSGLFW